MPIFYTSIIFNYMIDILNVVYTHRIVHILLYFFHTITILKQFC